MSLSHVKMYYEVHGEGNKNITMVHGWTESAKFWREQIPIFDKDKYRIIVLDLKGHGRSSKNMTGYMIRNHSYDVYELLDKLGVKETIMFGHSLGGMVSLDFYFRRPIKVNALCLFNTSYRAMRLPRSLAEIGGIGRFGLRKFLMTVYDFSPNRVFSVKKEENVQELIKEANDPLITPPRVSIMCGMGAFNFNVEYKLNRINVPVLILTGEKDAVTPPRLSLKMCKLIPNSTCHIIPETGHMAVIEKSEEVNKYILDFFQKNSL